MNSLKLETVRQLFFADKLLRIKNAHSVSLHSRRQLGSHSCQPQNRTVWHIVRLSADEEVGFRFVITASCLDKLPEKKNCFILFVVCGHLEHSCYLFCIYMIQQVVSNFSWRFLINLGPVCI